MDHRSHLRFFTIKPFPHRWAGGCKDRGTFWPKDVGKELWQNPPEHKIGICDGGVASLPVTHGPRMSSC